MNFSEESIIYLGKNSEVGTIMTAEYNSQSDQSLSQGDVAREASTSFTTSLPRIPTEINHR